MARLLAGAADEERSGGATVARLALLKQPF